MNNPLFTTDKKIILASASPRRIHFLRQLGLDFTSIPATIDETSLPDEPPDTFVTRLATAKAESIGADHCRAFVIGADTIVAIENRIIGKPNSPGHALQILQQLRGTSHWVVTGLCLHCPAISLTTSIVKTTIVTFGSFPDSVLQAYIDTGEPMDKAGAYGLQGTGGFLVEKIAGSCANAIGLPTNDLVRLLLTHRVIRPNR
ncbi:MAG TPA: septum formation protein Maf [Desulfobulbus sp.]|nr:septum formation protein Maf [Desulfobulbus sp.]